MRIFLSVSVLVFALSAAEEHRTINAFLSGDVILPCACKDRNQSKEFRWQTEKAKVYADGFSEAYKDRAQVFVENDSHNYSLHLNNITLADAGDYTCSFITKNIYTKCSVTLSVGVKFIVCQRETPDGSIQCEAEGPHQAQIQWYLDEELLRNSSSTNITQTVGTDPANPHRIHSKLFTPLKSIRTADLKCVVEAPRITIESQFDCPGRDDPYTQVPKEYWALLLLLMVPGFALLTVLCYKFSRKYQRRRSNGENIL